MRSTPEQRRLAGRAQYGTEVKNAVDADGKALSVGSTVIIMAELDSSRIYEVKQIGPTHLVLDDGTVLEHKDVELKNSTIAVGDTVKFVRVVDVGDDQVRMKVLEVNGDRALVEDATAPNAQHIYPTADLTRG
jgi:hypothetical protein